MREKLAPRNEMQLQDPAATADTSGIEPAKESGNSPLSKTFVLSDIPWTEGPTSGVRQKIFWSEMNQRMQQVAMEMLGPYGQLTGDSAYAVDHGEWAHAYLRSRGNTIEAGTSEIQRNIIGHFVLGMPKSY